MRATAVGRSVKFSESESVRITLRLAVYGQSVHPSNSYKYWMTQEWGGVKWPRQQWRHAFQQWRNNLSAVERSVSRVSDQGFIGETEAHLQAVLGWRLQKFSVSSRSELWRLLLKRECFMCNIWSVWFNETVIIPVLSTVAGWRLVETENPSACATVVCKLCKWAIALYWCTWV
jgi:hypothetical protein